MIKKVKFVSIPTANQDRALVFWTEKVGFRLVQDVPMGPDQRWIELEVPGAETHVVLFTPPGHEERVGQFVPMAWATKDVRETYEEMSGRGVAFVQPPKTESWGTSAIFKDADGNQFVLSSE